MLSRVIVTILANKVKRGYASVSYRTGKFNLKNSKVINSDRMSEETFLYFGYGSNLLRERLLVQNPTAVFKTIGRLDDYRLGFDFRTERWQGAIGSVFESPGTHVWGVVWEMNNSDMESLDRQEDVHQGFYKAIEVAVSTPSGGSLKCRAYELLKVGSEDKRPSPQYLSIIRRGAAQNNLPLDYQDRLAAIEHNGNTEELEIMKEIEKLTEQT